MKNINQCETCINNMEPGNLQMYGCVLDYINTRADHNVKVLQAAAMKACIVNTGNCPVYLSKQTLIGGNTNLLE